MPYQDGWGHHRNSKGSTRRERVSEALGEGIHDFVNGARLKAARGPYRGVEDIRDAGEGMQSAPGGRTSSPGKKLTWKEKRDADRILKQGKPKRR